MSKNIHPKVFLKNHMLFVMHDRIVLIVLLWQMILHLLLWCLFLKTFRSLLSFIQWNEGRFKWRWNSRKLVYFLVMVTNLMTCDILLRILQSTNDYWIEYWWYFAPSSYCNRDCCCYLLETSQSRRYWATCVK